MSPGPDGTSLGFRYHRAALIVSVHQPAVPSGQLTPNTFSFLGAFRRDLCGMAGSFVVRPQLSVMRRPEPLAVAVARELLGYLLSGAFREGERIPSERVLAAELGVARSAIREALKPLALLGIVDVRQGSGTYLCATTSDLLPQVIEWGLLLRDKTIHDLIEARQPIELALVRLAAERRDQDALMDLQGHLDTMHNCGGDVDAFAEADAAFHFSLGRAANNEVLLGILNSLRSLLAVWIRRVLTMASDTQALYDQHLAIFRAVQGRDAEKAVRAMEVHLTLVTARLLDPRTAEAYVRASPGGKDTEPLVVVRHVAQTAALGGLAPADIVLPGAKRQRTRPEPDERDPLVSLGSDVAHDPPKRDHGRGSDGRRADR